MYETFKDFLAAVNKATTKFSREYGKHPNVLVVGKEELEFLRTDEVMGTAAHEFNFTPEGDIERIWDMFLCKSDEESLILVARNLD
jgi:hypothetical protein